MNERDEFLDTAEAGVGGGGRFHILQPNRDLQSNWEVDLAKNLEEYLLKICSGEISADHDHPSVNFAEAALLLQGSIQVYSRKVEYLYSLVLHALEFLSQKRQDQQETTSTQPDGSEHPAVLEEDEIFLGLDVPVEAKNCLEDGLCKDGSSYQFSKIPQNLLVLEGDCLNTNADAGELESYLLATCDFYNDFLLLDPCDAGAVYEFLNNDAASKESLNQRGSSLRSKNRRSCLSSPSGRSAGTVPKLSIGKNKGVDSDQTFENNCNLESNGVNLCSGAQFDQCASRDDVWHCEEADVGCSNHVDDSEDEDEDPWKPLNPHEPGNLKIKPFRKGKTFGRQVIYNDKRKTIASEFPLAKLDDTISPELAEALGEHLHEQEKPRGCGSPSLYEKLRRSLVFGEEETFGGYNNPYEEYNDGEETDIPDFEQEDFDLAHGTDHMDTDVPLDHDMRKKDPADYPGAKEIFQGNLDSNTNLEDLCKSHLDALLASIAETEKQTELATRVSTWKQRIELTLEEQETHSPFDIHLYGEKILDKLLLEAESAGSISFSNVVMGQPKHEVARTFSALLQLVNNGNVDLQRPETGNEVVCHTADNPFGIRLLCVDGNARMEIHPSKKRLKSPLRKGCSKSSSEGSLKSQRQNGRFNIKLGKGSAIRCTPEGKRRRRSRLTEPVDFQSIG